MMLLGADPVVDWGKLGQVVAYSAVVGVGVALCFSLAILGAIRFGEARRNDGAGAAIGYAVLTTLGLAATVAAAVGAIIVMTNKG